ncbi:nucleoside/nucleotide kinase family protein [Demequina sp. SYSU T00192]|uniref:Nucleoside/nucleotide kinase family protein n=1 Tax=Demequina litoralis TaxID=3051660 RepID=A0ABT8GC97_9MICO|nr:nucleoside/nucleotide kinase family protein [Demequina sp. SYSU T00192]MDN4476759.1 nucleoside/nucleotide kinase family protein [Demequina sp. SYSU T00192]
MTDALVARAAALAAEDRAILGIAGIPGAGKSTLARELVAGLRAAGAAAAYLPMDGFHLSAAELARRALADRKGAPETFDVDGFVALLRRVRAAREDVLAPDYDRDLHDVVPGGLVVPAGARIVVTEGNYLGVGGGWEAVRPALDALWFLDVPWEVARERLIERRVATGRLRDDAVAWVDTVDAANARLVGASRGAADLVIPG